MSLEREQGKCKGEAESLSPEESYHSIQHLFSTNRFREALPIAHQAVSLAPDDITAYRLLGVCLLRTGQFREAAENYKKAIALTPDRFEYYIAFANADRVSTEDRPLIEKLSEMAKQPMSPRALIHLEFSVAKAFDDIGDFERALHHYDRAHDLSVKYPTPLEVPYDHENEVGNQRQIMKTITSDFIRRNMGLGLATEQPLLIVGVPRSGTTLTEQIFSRHPSVGTAAERIFIEANYERLFANSKADAISSTKAKAFCLAYVEELKRFGGDKLRVTDKMPQNYKYLGIVHMLFPNAHFVYIRRNPLDTAFSIYMTRFEAGPGYRHRKAQIVENLKLSDQLMAHWRSIIPANRLLEINYEDLVSNPEPVVRRMLDFAGLDWSEDCLRPEESNRFVNTPSVYQVKKPMSTSSVARWRNYAPWLGEFGTLLSGEESANVG